MNMVYQKPQPSEVKRALFLSLAFLLLLLPLSLSAQVAFDNSGIAHCDGGVTNVCTSGTTTLSFSYTTGSGSNLGMAAFACLAVSCRAG